MSYRETIKEAIGMRIKRVRLRIRNGKIQRNVRVNNYHKGFKLIGGKKLVRMSAKEKLDRKRGARRAKIKRRAKKARILLKLRRSLRKRNAMGL